MTAIFYICLFIFMFVCALLCLIILVQESKSLGLGASFGGDAGESLFGTSTADVLKKFTAWLAFIFMAACVILSFWTGTIGRGKPKIVPTTIVVPPENERKVTLVARARQDAWLTVRVDGILVFQNPLRMGSVESWIAKDKISISGKNVDQLELELNGKMIGPLGKKNRWAISVGTMAVRMTTRTRMEYWLRVMIS